MPLKSSDIRTLMVTIELRTGAKQTDVKKFYKSIMHTINDEILQVTVQATANAKKKKHG